MRNAILLSLTLPALGFLLACGPKTDPAAEAAAKKKQIDDALAVLGPSIGKISAFQPHIVLPDEKDPYAPANRQSDVRAATAAANEVRHEATAARQALKKAGSPVTAPIETALDAVSTACADAKEEAQIQGCLKSITGLDEALDKASADATAAGAGSKLPRVGKDAITKEAEATTRHLVTARGPGPEETAFCAKRADPKATFDDLDKACGKALEEADAAATQYENADEPIRLVAVTRKMGMASQCKRLRTAETARTELNDVCKKKPNSSECAIACGKAKAVIDDGLPAAYFEVIKKEQEDACKSVK